MGGCRCTFRDCGNGTASRKDLHYFRFPVRDPERLQLWAELANRSEFLTLPVDKLANKVVCQLHFEKQMFMNYLCDRLSKIAVPRLMPQPDGSTLNVVTGDVLLGENTGTAAATVPKAEQPPLEPVEACTLQSSRKTSKRKNESIGTLNNWNEQTYAPSGKKIKILNSESMSFTKGLIPCKVIRIKTSPSESGHARKVAQLAVRRDPNQTEQGDATSLGVGHTMIEIQDEDTAESYCPQETTQPSTTEVMPMRPASTEPSSIATPAPPVHPPPPVPIVDPALAEKMVQNNKELVEVKKLVQELLDRPIPEAKPITQPAPSQKVVMEKGPQLTKAQLFSGIKRYLNPTMVTLLRMELFSGSAERPWKPDEKSLAVDLLDIGEHVYDHFRDEFRFRLPSKAVAQEWKAAGELDADDAC